MFKRIAIVNRGEAAMRLIHAVRDLNAEHPDRDPVTTIALCTDGERSAMFAREADESYSLGPASQRPYLNHQLLAHVLTEVGADAVWVGWGFVAEDAAFADLVESLGIRFIGPSGDAMRKLGDKIGSKLIAEEVGVPVAPWSRGGVDTLEDALAQAERIGYPLMLKATAGGGGRGIRKVTSADELTDAYQRTRDEAQRSFGSDVVFLEKLVTGARHVEVQLIADGHGTAWAIGVRDCTVQRRNQKVIEESSSPLLSTEQADELKAAAERLALAVGYQGAGTVEFLYRAEDRLFAFLEVNTRLQVEHPITEVTNQFDLVKAQIHVAAGGSLEERPNELGHAVEARLNAEDPDRDFAPAPGLITRLDLPAGPGIRVDTGVTEGDSIPADFDSMIAKIIAHGRTREEALGRLRRAMAETTVVIEGGATNKSFILELLRQDAVTGPADGDAWADTAWIDRTRADGGLVADRYAGVALVVAAIEAYEETTGLETERLLATARGGRPQTQHTSGAKVDLKLRGTTHSVTTFAIAPGRYRVVVDGQPTEATLQRLDDVHGRITVGDEKHRIISATHGPIHLIEVDGVTHRVSRDEGGVLRSPAPALVVATPAKVGDEVEAGATLVVLESMKMETAVHAPFSGRVKQLMVMTGSQVESMAPLVRLEPLGDGSDTEGPSAETAAVDVPPSRENGNPAVRAHRLLSQLSAILMGFDVDPSSTTLSNYLAAREEALTDGTDVMAEEISFLTLFADLAELSRNRPFDEQSSTELRVHSDREHFHRYLTTLDTDRAEVPAQFVDRLTAVLSHYDVDSLERTPELEQAVFRIFLAQKRIASDVPMVLGILDRWIAESAPDADRAANARAQLERLVRATQLRFPAVGDLARSVRFRWFDQPLVDAERAFVVAGVGDEVEYLAENPDASDYDERIARLAAIPEWTANFLAVRLGRGTPAHEPMLEVLLRKYYTEHELSNVRRLVVDGRAVILADHVLDGRTRHFVGSVGTAAELLPGAALETLVAQQVAARAPGDDTVVELYVSWPGHPDADELSSDLVQRLGSWQWDASVQRVAIGVCTADGAVDYRTFRFDGGIHEDERIRGLHPMAGRQLDLWRLRDFHTTRLPAPADVLLFDCVAKSNPDDRRLVAMAQVRQLAVIRDEDGTLVSLPHAERAVANCLEAIRRTRSARGAAGSRLDVNHVWVHVWPEVDLGMADITPMKDRITPLSDGAGIEEVLCQGRFVRGDNLVPMAVRFHAQPGAGVTTTITAPPSEPLKPLDDYAGKVLRTRRRGLVHPYELSATLTGENGSLTELDLDENNRLVEVDRAPGHNRAGLIAAKVTTPTALHPDGITRIVLSGDPTKGLGAVAEPECRRIIAAIDLAEELDVPVEWFTLSSGARISMDSGTENMDWVGAALRRIVEFTQTGGEINVVVAGINVGAQPYWNAEATMLMHTKGILVMTPDSAMVLTGKQSLDFSGGVSAEDNHGIGGYDRVMGPNGQAQYWARDLGGAMGILMSHYDHTWVAPGETGPRRAASEDPVDRDVSEYPHTGEFATVGQIFSSTHNPDRKKPFDIRTVIASVCDQDHPRVERWAGMAEAETAVVIDARVGGHSVSVIGIESKPVARAGFPPTDGPDTFTAGTLFPRSSKKVARAINAASGNRPLVVLANLSGFDGSPESMRNLQLEYGAEIGRAIVNFDGPIVFVVISRYHGGAFVVFSKRLNENMTVLALEGSYASVIGGAPAAAVVFARDVDKRTGADPRVAALHDRLRNAAPEEQADLQVELADTSAAVRAEKISEVAAEFDAVHSIHRAVEVGSVDRVISLAELRPAIVHTIENHDYH